MTTTQTQAAIAVKALIEELRCVRDYVEDTANGAPAYRGVAVSEMAKGDIARIDAAIKLYEVIE